ncbi:MAG: Smr/MutS family protein, partial [Bacteroidales bacterium]
EKNIREIENIKLKRKAILDEAKIESQKLLSEVNKRIENTIKAIKESNADKEITKQARKELNEFIESLNLEEFNSHHEIEKKQELLKSKLEKRKQNEAKEKPEIIKIDANKINIGSKVKIKDKELFGEIIDFNEKTAVVAFGNMYTSVPLDSLEKISQEDFKELKKTSGLAKTIYSQKILDFNPFIDIRGNTVEEAIKKVTNFVDEAAMLDFKEIKILHGKGNGILRQHIRDYLKTFPYVEACYDEDIRFGGSGITIVKLK